MCDQAYVNLLREKVRQLEAEENRVAAFGTTPHVRFVPWIIPAQSQSQDVSNLEGLAEAIRHNRSIEQ
jgi:hypothetical protein